jgi:hypothetical protein
MRKTTIAMLGTAVLSVAGCGSSSGGGTFADQATPTAPVNLTVYVNDSKISISPASVGAGPVVFIVTNQGSKAHSLAISAAGGSHPIASTAPINPQGTTQVSVDFKPGAYSVATGSARGTDAQLANAPPIAPASLHIGPQRSNKPGELITP